MHGLPDQNSGRFAYSTRRWTAHASHSVLTAPHHFVERRGKSALVAGSASKRVTLDGSRGEGGGQILRTALSLALTTGHPFRIVRIRANREKPGLRPRHLAAVEAAAALCDAEVSGGVVGSQELTFRPGPFAPRDLDLDIGAHASAALILQTLYLPLALKAVRPIRLRLMGGTFSTSAPSYPFLTNTWIHHVAALGLKVAVAMPRAGFHPGGGGPLEAWIEPGQPQPIIATERGVLRVIRGIVGTANLPGHSAGERMRGLVLNMLARWGLTAEIELVDWPGLSPGAILALTVEHEGAVPATFVGLGERGKSPESVVEGVLAELLAYEGDTGTIDPHSADQILPPLALAEGRSVYTVTEVTEHLRTNAAIAHAFLNRSIEIDEDTGRVVVG